MSISKSFTRFVLPLLLLASAVHAHGTVSRFLVNGVPAGNVIRPVNSQNPNYGAFNPAINCGDGARPAPQIADVNPGDTVSFDWRTAGGSPWPHNTGPILTYVARTDVPSNEADSAPLQWAKIDQRGKRDDYTWEQQDLMSGALTTVVIPANLLPGFYIIRHEIIALHLALQEGPEYYPQCIQIRVLGNGNGVADITVTFPGGYNDADPGLRGNPYSVPPNEYPYPGPRMAVFIARNGGVTPPPAPTEPAPVPTEPTPQPAPAPVPSDANTGNNNGYNNGNTNAGNQTSSPPRTCKLRRSRRTEPAPAPVQARAVEQVAEHVDNHRRHISRVMSRMFPNAPKA